MKAKIIAIFAAILMVLSIVPIVFAAEDTNTGYPLGIENIVVKVDGDILSNGQTLRTNYERGDVLDTKVILTTAADQTGNMKDLEIRAWISGDDHHNIEEVTKTFDTESDVVYTKSLKVELPENMDKDNYKLRITVSDRYGESATFDYNLKVSAPKNKLVVKDIVFTPETYVKAGRALIATARVKNVGEEDAQDVKVTVSIPDLGISGSDYLDDIQAEDSKSTEEMYMRIPDCTKAGTYKATVKAVYDDGYETAEQEFDLKVVSDDTLCTAQSSETKKEEANSVIMIGAPVQSVERGKGGAVYPITLHNAGNTAKTYTISVEGLENWATTTTSPSNVVVLESGKDETVYVYVSANEEASLGEHLFTVNVKTGDDTAKQIVLKTVVAEPQNQKASGLKVALEIGLIALVIILIGLAVVIGINKAKSKEDEESEEVAGQTYY